MCKYEDREAAFKLASLTVSEIKTAEIGAVKRCFVVRGFEGFGCVRL